MWLSRHLQPYANEFIFCDTGAEAPETYEFIRECSRQWGLSITCLRVVVNPKLYSANSYEIIRLDEIGPDLRPWEAMVKKYGVPAINLPFCTDRMKTEPSEKYLKDKYGDDYILMLGIRYDEPSRLWGKKLLRESGMGPETAADVFNQMYLGSESGAPQHCIEKMRQRVAKLKSSKLWHMAGVSDMGKEDVLAWWRSQPFDLNLPEHLGNCTFCIKKSAGKVALAAKDRPDSAQRFIQLVEGDSVRVEGRKDQSKAMYRERRKLSDIIALYSDVSRDDLAARLKSTHVFDAGTCSESCEAFGAE